MNWRYRWRYVQKSCQYILMRHLIALSGMERVALRSGQRIFANSIPKAGTHLLRKVINQLPGVVPSWTYHIDHQISGWQKQIQAVRRGQVVTAHLPWSTELAALLEQQECKLLLMIRDLRDIAVSGAFYGAYKDKSHRLHHYLNSLSSDDERLMASIAGIDGHLLADGIRSKSWGEHAEGFLPWFDDDACLVIRFEDLIGESGGGSRSRQLQAISSIAAHLGVSLDEESLAKIADNAFSTRSRTYRKGQIGDWQNHFNEEHKRVFQQTAGDALIRMGYVENSEW